MKKKIISIFVGKITAIISWLALSYVFFPIKLSAPMGEYFIATMGHMIPLKIFITILLTLASVIIYEQFVNKKENH